MAAHAEDIDGQETTEWVEALDSVVAHDGPERAGDLLDRVLEHARSLRRLRRRVDAERVRQHDPARARGRSIPGDLELEHRIRAIIRWNAMATVLRANAESSELGGHIASYQSAATLYEVGFHHFWNAPSEKHGGDLVYIQGHSSPGVYARAFLEGRLTEEDLLGFRQEVSKGGLSSYPHPWLMPDFWQFPTVSMGLGPIMAIYQARFMKYLTGRGLADTTGRKVWAFLGDGETDEPESLGAISLAGHENLDNLVFVVNCNLQRLDGPVRGNGKIIKELETVFRGAGWNVLKVIWGNKWDPLLAGRPRRAAQAPHGRGVDGEYQTFKSRDGAYVREQLLRRLPRAGQARRGLVRRRDLGAQPRRPRPDEGLRRLRRGDALRGPPDRDPRQDGQGLRDGRGRRGPEHHPPAEEDDRRGAATPSATASGWSSPTSRSPRRPSTSRPRTRRRWPTCASAARRSAAGCRCAAGARRSRCPCPELRAFKTQLEGTGEREISTTMAFVRILVDARARQADRQARRADRARRVAHVRHGGHVPPARDLQPGRPALPARGLRAADVLQGGQEGPDPPGGHQRGGRVLVLDRLRHVVLQPRRSRRSRSTSTTRCSASSGSATSPGRPATTARAGSCSAAPPGARRSTARACSTRTATRTCCRSTIPNCVSYDPTYGYEVAVIVQDGLRRMVAEQEDVFYYLTLMNENYPHPAMPEGAEEGILQGDPPDRGRRRRRAVQLLGSGTILREVEAAARAARATTSGVDGRRLQRHELHRAARATAWRPSAGTALHPRRGRRASAVRRERRCRRRARRSRGDRLHARARGADPPVRARRLHRARHRRLRPQRLPRARCASFFEVDRHHVAVAALRALGRDEDAAEAIAKYEIDADAEAPWRR